MTVLAALSVTPLPLTLPPWLAPPLVVLSLLGWAALGGRTALFALLWFAGYAFGVSLFGRQEHFYWLALLIPIYGVGLALVPRALIDLVAVLRRSPDSAGRAAPA